MNVITTTQFTLTTHQWSNAKWRNHLSTKQEDWDNDNELKGMFVNVVIPFVREFMCKRHQRSSDSH